MGMPSLGRLERLRQAMPWRNHQPSRFLGYCLTVGGVLGLTITAVGLGERPVQDLSSVMADLSVLCLGVGEILRATGNSERKKRMSVLLQAGFLIFFPLDAILIGVESYLAGDVFNMLFFPVVAFYLCSVVLRRYRSSGNAPDR